jgi:hypothetical protein
MPIDWSLLAVIVLMTIYIAWSRHRRNHAALLAPLLREHGLTLISSTSPRLFQTGPFPKFSIQVQPIETQVGGIGGEYSTYRIVTVRSSDGRQHTVWAKLSFAAFRLRHVEWRPALSTLNR